MSLDLKQLALALTSFGEQVKSLETYARYTCPECAVPHNQGPRRMCDECFKAATERRKAKRLRQQQERREAKRQASLAAIERNKRKAINKALRQADPFTPTDRVLESLRAGRGTWNDLKAATKLNSDGLSDVLARLWNDGIIRPVAGAAVRTYRLL